MTGATATNISSGGGDGGSSVNCPTLTTPTLTPTTLRNIDQIFAGKIIFSLIRLAYDKHV